MVLGYPGQSALGWMVQSTLGVLETVVAAVADIYIFGGNDGAARDEIEFYNQADDSWTASADTLGATRQRTASAQVSAKGYQFMGTDSGGNKIDKCEEYDPSTDTATSATDASAARSDHGAASVGTEAFCYYGADSGGFDDQCENYTPSTFSWSSKTAGPAPAREHIAASTLGGLCYAIGGGTLFAQEDDTDEYDPDGNSWTSRTNMIAGRDELAATTASDAIYAFGGHAGVKTNEEYVVDTWTSKTDLPTLDREDNSGGTSGDFAYCLGGRNGGVANARNDEYDPAGDSWTNRTDLISATYHMGATEIDL